MCHLCIFASVKFAGCAGAIRSLRSKNPQGRLQRLAGPAKCYTSPAIKNLSDQLANVVKPARQKYRAGSAPCRDGLEPEAMFTVADVVLEYLVAKSALQQAGLLTTGALVKAHSYCLAFADMFGDLPLDKCRRGDLRRFLAAHPEYQSPHTKSDACGAVVTCFRWAVEDGLIAYCPYAKPRDLPTPQPREAITREEVKAILGHARHGGRGRTPLHFRFALWFLAETGVRTSELYRLDWSEYDPGRGCFEMRSKSTHRTGQKRIIALSKRAWRVINWLRRKAARTATVKTDAGGVTTYAAFPTQGKVFLNGRGRPWNRRSFGKLFRLHADAAGVRSSVSAYCCRHGFCCAALERGIGERQLADYLGHSSTRYISWYGRAVKSRVDYLRDVADRTKG